MLTHTPPPCVPSLRFKSPRPVSLGKPLPPLLASALLFQSLTMAVLAAGMLFSGHWQATLAAAIACLAFLGIGRMLRSRCRHAWRAARKSSLVGVGLSAFGTLYAARLTNGAVLYGAGLLTLHCWYAVALHRASSAVSPDRKRRKSVHHARRLWATLPVVIFTFFFLEPTANAQFQLNAQGTLDGLLDKVPDSYSSKRDPVIKRLKVYRKWASMHRQKALQELEVRYDRAIRTIGPVSHQALHVKATHEWLMGTSGPPKDKAAMAWIVKFVDAYGTKQATLWKPLSLLIQELNKNDRTSEAAQLHQAFLGLEAPERLGEVLVLLRTFRGYRVSPDGKKMRSMLFRFQTGDDASWAGVVELDPNYRGHPVYEFSGGFEGPYLIAQTGAIKAFGGKGDHAWTYTGSLFGTSIVGTYSGRDKKGKLQRGIFMTHSK